MAGANPAEIDAQKAALLKAIAQNGSQGQAAFQAEQQRRQQAQQAAVQAIADRSKMSGVQGSAPSSFIKDLQAQQNALGSVYAQDAALAQRGFADSIAQTGAANAAYMDQARAAIPVVNAQTAGTVAQIRAEQEQRRLDAQAAEEERAFRREQMNFEREQMRQKQTEETAATTDEETAKQQESLLNRATRTATPAVDSILRDTVSISEDLPQAINYAQRIIRSYKVQQDAADAQGVPQEGPLYKLGWKKGFDARDVLRYLYEFYTGKKSPINLKDFGKALKAEGVDPNRLPGYADYVARTAGGSGGSGSGGKAKVYTPQTGNVETPAPPRPVPIPALPAPDGKVYAPNGKTVVRPGATVTYTSGPYAGKWVHSGSVWVRIG